MKPSNGTQEAWVSAGSYRTYYQTAGQGKTILLLHGAGGYGSVFSSTIPLLSEKNRVITPDIVGHGQTEGPGILYTEQAYCSWLKSFITALDLERVIIIGHSQGGSIALRFASRYPEFVSHLVLVNAISLGIPSVRETLLLLLAMFSPSRRHTLDLVGTVMFSGPKLKRREMASRFFRSEVSIPKGIRGFIWMLLRTWQIALPVSRRRLLNLSVPVLLVWGEDDAYFPLSHARRVVHLRPQWELKAIQNAGHVPFIEQPEAFISALESFLGRS